MIGYLNSTRLDLALLMIQNATLGMERVLRLKNPIRRLPDRILVIHA